MKSKHSPETVSDGETSWGPYVPLWNDDEIIIIIIIIIIIVTFSAFSQMQDKMNWKKNTVGRNIKVSTGKCTVMDIPLFFDALLIPLLQFLSF